MIPLTARTDDLLRRRLEHYAKITHRNLNQATNHLLDAALTSWETDRAEARTARAAS